MEEQALQGQSLGNGNHKASEEISKISKFAPVLHRTRQETGFALPQGPIYVEHDAFQQGCV